MNLIKDALGSVLRLFVDGARVLVNHGPELLCLFLFGWAGRTGFLWLATIVSDVNATAAVFILPLAPLSTLLSLVLMLRATAPTLSAFSNVVTVSTRERWQADLSVAAQVMIPFLAVYATAGMLKEDARNFVVDATADEALNAALGSMDFGRTVYAEGWGLIALVVGALVARKVISLLQLTQRHLAWSAAAIYIEVLWMITLANAFAHQIDQLSAWVQSRRAVAGVVEWWDGLVAWVRSWSLVATTIVDAVITVVSDLGNLIIVPVAWLVIGAAVLGTTLKSNELSFATHDEVTDKMKSIPQPVRRVVAQVVEPITTPVQNTLQAIGRVASAGVLSMVLFCIVFSIASGLQALTYLGLREVFGPGPSLRQYAISPYLLLAGRTVYFVVALSLLAAAVNAVVLSQRAGEDAGEASAASAADVVALSGGSSA
ncbi:MAG TPA: hypothetical protein PLK46_07435 [Propioniciclava sp.]|uniref:hypothetical protein n=1 Tax=Propioniciclava sp. TaxID=2038686 RepID=UPI002B8F4583|nr:hypothetical protein [Propioniciclava sp.]HRL80147.1 hypothetical protein [Propioniciclava sp.]